MQRTTLDKILSITQVVLLTAIITVFVISVGVYSGKISDNFAVLRMEFFYDFYRRAINYLLLIGLWHLFNRNIFSNEREKSIATILIYAQIILDAFGNLFGWYSVGQVYSVIWYDDLVHFLGGGLYTVTIFLVLKNIFKYDSLLLIIIASFGVAFALGTLFGVSEYLLDTYGSTYMVGGLADAISDNIYDFLGSISTLIILILIYRKKSNFFNN